jgi:hypothetical protein
MKIGLLLIAVNFIGCSSSDDTGTQSPPLEADAAPSDAGAGLESSVDGRTDEDGSSIEDFAASASDFDCDRNSEWTTVGLAHYKNALGHTAEMLACRFICRRNRPSI